MSATEHKAAPPEQWAKNTQVIQQHTSYIRIYRGMSFFLLLLLLVLFLFFFSCITNFSSIKTKKTAAHKIQKKREEKMNRYIHR